MIQIILQVIPALFGTGEKHTNYLLEAQKVYCKPTSCFKKIYDIKNLTFPLLKQLKLLFPLLFRFLFPFYLWSQQSWLLFQTCQHSSSCPQRLGASSPHCSHGKLPSLNVPIHSVKIIGQFELLKLFKLKNPGQPRRRKISPEILNGFCSEKGSFRERALQG